ncbi:hypothetical protein FD34_GL000918 [Limosilactobacillus pontis DSM 8475]|uniref:Pyridoxamine kinase/Phosphomethylpyrimidine kinase domain-containing protein n=1 Tax=Limosilactobacillus pontis DSM 8475 TaxID=1423794 RepID=A0A922PTN3_9LACO|nr:hypothetical protein FD34_GL000918 [Limosilactobacillus pontis DSM 8475]
MTNDFPQALTIAGTDSGGGAGITADFKTMQERHVFATMVVVAVTAQNTLGVQDAFPMPIKMVRRPGQRPEDPRLQDGDAGGCRPRTGRGPEPKEVRLWSPDR